MTDQSLFNDNTNTQETPAAPQSDPFADLLQGIRNEQGEQKYRDVKTALEALKNSQQFIEQLKNEKRDVEAREAAARVELEKMGTIDDYVKRLQNKDANADAPKETPKGGEGLSEARLAQLLDERLTAREMQAVEAANRNAVEAELQKVHGDNAAGFIKQRAKELGMSVNDLETLAKRTPNAALQLLGGTPKPSVAPSQGSIIPPREVPNDNPMPKWERGVAHGGLTNKELVERWRVAKDYTYKRIKVEK